MNKNSQSPSEEVDLGQLFQLIENAFNSIKKFIKSIFLIIFSVFIDTIKPIIRYFKIILVSMILSVILGYGLEKFSKNIYASKMLVKPYFESKFQLISNIGYYNALISDRDYGQLSLLFKIDETDAKNLVEFEIKPGPETENDRILEFENFIRNIDSTRAQNISLDTYIENRSVYSGSVFEINVKSFKKNIFKSLEEGLNSNFKNEYSIKKMKKRDSLISLEKERILKSLNEIDSLQKVYIDVMKKESNGDNQGAQVTLRDGMSLIQERIETKEYELLDKQLELRKVLTSLESQKVEEDVYFDTLSSFQDVGSKHFSIWNRYSIVLPALVFILLSLLFLLTKFVRFVKAYKGSYIIE